MVLKSDSDNEFFEVLTDEGSVEKLKLSWMKKHCPWMMSFLPLVPLMYAMVCNMKLI